MESQCDPHSPASSLRTSLLPSDSDGNEFEEFFPIRVQHPPRRPPPLYPEENTKPLHITAAWSLAFFVALLFLPAFLLRRPHVGQLPTSRKSASMAAFTNNAALNLLNNEYPYMKNSGLNSSSDILVVYSGMGHHRRLLNDTYAFDLQTRQWIRVLPGKHEAKEVHPDPRWKSAAVSIPLQGLLVLFGDAMQHAGGGGEGDGDGAGKGAAGKKFDDQVWRLELPKLKWQAANNTTKGRALPSVIPKARRGHSVDLLAASPPLPPSSKNNIKTAAQRQELLSKTAKEAQETTLVLFGGVSSTGEELNDTWKAVISWPNITWTQLGAHHVDKRAVVTPSQIARTKEFKPFGIRPPPRHGHATDVLETSTDILSSQELKNKGKEEKQDNEEDKESLLGKKITEENEESRQRYLVLFGGRDQTQFFNDLWLLNIDKVDPISSGNSSTDKSNFKENKKSDWVLFEVDEASPLPPPRAHHTIAIYEDKLYLWGGLSGPRVDFSKPLDDLWVFTFENRRWYRLYKHGNWPLPRFLFSSVVHQSQGAQEPSLYVFGGESLDRCKLNDLWSLNLKTLIWRQLTPNYFAKRRCDKLFGGRQ